MLELSSNATAAAGDAPTMCPTFLATGEEYMSTRGPGERDSERTRTCASKAATRCGRGSWRTPSAIAFPARPAPRNARPTSISPSSKAEVIHARHERDGLPMRVRLLSAVDSLGKIGCAFPVIANAALDFPLLRVGMEKTFGLSSKRTLPHYTKERFDRWFVRHESRANTTKRGRVILWDDTFVRYHEPQIGIAAVSVLETLGFEVALLADRKCCGRPAFSQGNLNEAARLGRRNLELFSHAGNEAPILFLEPSCYSMFVEDYRELDLPGAESIAARRFLFEKFIDDLLEREPGALQFQHRDEQVAIHAHCHAKSLLHPGFIVRLSERLPGRKATLLETGCCGMAGAFGMLSEK